MELRCVRTFCNEDEQHQRYNSFAADGTHVAVALQNNVNLYHVQDRNLEIALVGHHKSISSLKFSVYNEQSCLYTASSDYILVWIIDEVNNSHLTNEQVRGHILVESSFPPNYLSLSE